MASPNGAGLRGVIFDMGGTLLDYHPAGHENDLDGWQGMEAKGADGLRSLLVAQGYLDLPPVAEARRINQAVVQRHWEAVMRQQQENARLADILAEVMAAWGVPAARISAELRGAAIIAYTNAIQTHLVRPRPFAAQTLAALRERGLRIGLISNTVWPGVMHLADLDRWGLAQYLEHSFFSADEGIWKPRPEIFQRALAALDLQPAQAAYVGDSLYSDVYGAQNAGLKGIWIESTMVVPEGFTITPDAAIRHLDELPGVIESLSLAG